MKILEQFFNLLFPKYCLGCKTEGVWVCEACRETLQSVKNTMCPWCSRVPTVCGFLCQECKAKTGISQLLTMYDYKQELVEKIVLHLKYAYVEEIAGLMAQDMSRHWSREGRKGVSYIVMPIPLHSKRLRERGFNQAEHLARNFAKSAGMLCATHVLARTQHTKPQVTLSKEERSSNVKGAFTVRDGKSLKGKNIIVVDDVCTTGSTLMEAARVLTRAGAKKVTCLVFARG